MANKEKVPDSAWKPLKGRSRVAAVEEQDRTAGGRERRLVVLSDNRRSTASIELKKFSAYRIYAYLRYSTEGRTVNKYLGDVTSKSRDGALKKGWQIAREKGLVGKT